MGGGQNISTGSHRSSVSKGGSSCALPCMQVTTLTAGFNCCCCVTIHRTYIRWLLDTIMSEALNAVSMWSHPGKRPGQDRHVFQKRGLQFWREEQSVGNVYKIYIRAQMHLIRLIVISQLHSCK